MTIYKKITTALWIAIACSAMSFFGYVYEAIVDVPNMFGASPTDAKQMWTAYHSLTNPIHYHILPAMGAILGLAILWRYRSRLSSEQQKKLNIAIFTTIFANILTGIAVTQLNNRLYFGNPIDEPIVVINLAIAWSLVNFIRLLIVLICIISLLKIFNFTLQSD